MNLQHIYLQLENISQELGNEKFDGASSYANELYDLACEVRNNYESLRKVTGK